MSNSSDNTQQNLSDGIQIAKDTADVAKTIKETAKGAKDVSQAAGKTAVNAAAKSNPVTGIISIFFTATSMARRTVKKEMDGFFDGPDYEDETNMAGWMVLLLFLLPIILIILLAFLILSPVAILTYANVTLSSDATCPGCKRELSSISIETQICENCGYNLETHETLDEAINKISIYFTGQTEKIKFLEELIGKTVYDKSTSDMINELRRIDESNVEIYKAIIDEGIRKSFNDKAKRYVSFSEFTKSLITGCDIIQSQKNYLEQPYPYTRMHTDGFYYTIDDFLNDRIPDDELNNDLNYAEIICVLSQKSDYANMAFSYSEFYDLLINDRVSDLFYEMRINSYQYFYIDSNRQLIKVEQSNVNSITDAINDGRIQADPDFVLKHTYRPSLKFGNPEYREQISGDEEEEEIFILPYYLDITIMPYGLRELYAIAEIDPYDSNFNVHTMYNIDVLDENERWTRARFQSNTLGISLDDKRDEWSFAISCTDTGRSAYAYMDESLNSGSSIGVWDPVGGGYQKYNPTGESVILDMPQYINQGDYPNNFRGTDGKGVTIKQAGCTDCSYTMAAAYFNRKKYDIVKISAEYVSENQFQTARFLSEYNMMQEPSKEPFDLTKITSYITAGDPVILYIKGYWEYGGTIYHGTENGHFLLIMGYDENGLYVYDPGRRSNTENGPIPYDAFAYMETKEIRHVSSKSGTFTPYYSVNTIRDGGAAKNEDQ